MQGEMILVILFFCVIFAWTPGYGYPMPGMQVAPMGMRPSDIADGAGVVVAPTVYVPDFYVPDGAAEHVPTGFKHKRPFCNAFAGCSPGLGKRRDGGMDAISALTPKYSAEFSDMVRRMFQEAISSPRMYMERRRKRAAEEVPIDGEGESEEQGDDDEDGEQQKRKMSRAIPQQDA